MWAFSGKMESKEEWREPSFISDITGTATNGSMLFTSSIRVPWFADAQLIMWC
jgi:hypothetical protein